MAYAVEAMHLVGALRLPTEFHAAGRYAGLTPDAWEHALRGFLAYWIKVSSKSVDDWFVGMRFDPRDVVCAYAAHVPPDRYAMYYERAYTFPMSATRWQRLYELSQKTDADYGKLVGPRTTDAELRKIAVLSQKELAAFDQIVDMCQYGTKKAPATWCPYTYGYTRRNGHQAYALDGASIPKLQAYMRDPSTKLLLAAGIQLVDVLLVHVDQEGLWDNPPLMERMVMYSVLLRAGLPPRFLASEHLHHTSHTTRRLLRALVAHASIARLVRCFGSASASTPSSAFAKYLPVIVQAADAGYSMPYCNRFSELVAWTKRAEKAVGGVRKACPDQALRRAADALAQRDPDRAIKHYKHEYRTGRDIAPVIGQVIAQMQAWQSDGVTTFVHGRDGELVYEVARRAGVRRMKYAVTSQTMTSNRPDPERGYAKYLTGILPKNTAAVHLDTGYHGTVPEWFEKQGWRVAKIALIEANDDVHDRQIQIHGAAGVVRLLEDSAQRLEGDPSWGKLCYAEDAPGFWAKVYGVCDVLGLPRRAGQKADAA